TVQDLLPVHAETGDKRVLPKLEVNSGVARDDPAWGIESGDEAPRTTNTSSRVEYEYGSRVEQVIAAPGSVTRVSVGVVIPFALDARTQERIREMVKVAAGIDEGRGDEVVVRTLAELGAQPESAEESVVTDLHGAHEPAHAHATASADPSDAAEEELVSASEAEAQDPSPAEPTAAPAAESPVASAIPTSSRTFVVASWPWLAAAGLAAVLLAGAVVMLRRGRGNNEELSAAERQRLLGEIRRALGDDDTAGTSP